MDEQYSYLKSSLAMVKEIQYNYELIVDKIKVDKKPAPSKFISNTWPRSIQEYYAQMNGSEIFWSHSKFKAQPRISGCIRILDAETLSKDSKGIVWFDHTPQDDPLRKFKLIDFFADEAAVGFYEGDHPNDQMYLYFFEGDPLPLGVDFEGYHKLLCESRGLFYWQQVLRAILEGKENQESIDFKLYMPQIHSGFSYVAFANKYNSLKIDI
jgi:hypothetical protein